MSELGEAYKALAEHNKVERQEKKRLNKARSTQILADKGIPFQSFNNGVHLVVGTFDFWPSTGKFISHVTGEKGRGVFKLIKKIKDGEL